MKKATFFTLLTLLSAGYSVFTIGQMVFGNPAPMTLECVGLMLDPAKRYSISNNSNRTDSNLILDFPQGEGMMPKTLGEIFYNPAASEFQLRTSSDIIDPNQETPTNPLHAFARTSRERLFGKATYYGPDAVVPAQALRDGIRFNSPAGDRSSRVGIRLLEFDRKPFLTASTEGIGTKYLLEANAQNRFPIICKEPINSHELRVFFFNKTSSRPCNYTIEVQPHTPFNYSYRVLNADDAVTLTGDSGQPEFQVGSYLFKISSKFGEWELRLLTITLILLGCFQAFLIISFIKAPTPPVKSVIASRILLNCVAFLSVPLFLISLRVSHNRLLYLAALTLLNASYFTSKRFLHKIGFVSGKTSTLVAAVLLMLLLPFVYAFAANENVLGIPVLHIQKLAVLVLIFVTGGDTFRKSGSMNWIRLGLIVAYSVTLSAITSDIGSFLYTCIALLLVELVRKTLSPKALLSYLLVLTAGLFIFYNLSDDFFANRKVYRIIAPYTSPDSEKLSTASEADRETYSSLYLIQKQLIEDSVPRMSMLQVPAPMRSTSFSDFAVFWSLALGKGVFAILFASILTSLLYELLFLLFLSVRPIRINKTQAFSLPINRESEFVRFLLAFAVVTFSYPVFSNLLLIPLTGQSYPCLSISILEVLFLILFLLPISSVFTNPKYIEANEEVAYSYSDLLRNLRFGFIVCMLLFTLVCGIKTFSIYRQPDGYSWQKVRRETESQITPLASPDDKPALVIHARQIVGESNWSSIKGDKKRALREVASLYYAGRPYNQLYSESSFFQNSSESLLSRMNLGSYFADRRVLVSGSRGPFGDVFRHRQEVNGREREVYTNDFYASIPPYADTIKPDLTAELSRELKNHLDRIGIASNIGAIVVVNNKNGGIVANSSYPLKADVNSNEIHYNIGSLKKILLAYCALVIDSNYKGRVYNGKTFDEFIKWSDDVYAASLLREVMLNHESEFASVLERDFGMPLISDSQDGYFDKKPDLASYSKPLDKSNELYRYSIGQQKPYQLLKVVQWYGRIAARKKINTGYFAAHDGSYEPTALADTEWKFLQRSLNSALQGTAAVVGEGLAANRISTTDLMAKTGTAESERGKFNSSSSCVLVDPNYTIAIMLKGKIPTNAHNVAAKNLMVRVIPVLKKYRIIS